VPPGASMPQNAETTRTLPWLAALLAWIIPGAGHVYIGRVARGIIIFLTVAATFWTGIAIGGVMTIDKENERWWFLAEMCSGVHGLIGWQKAMERQINIDAQLAREGLASVYPQDVVAHAYTGIAGLLNLMCVFDVLILSLINVHGEPIRPDDIAKRQSPEER